MEKFIEKSTILDYDGSGIITLAANAFGNIDADMDISLPGSFLKTIRDNFSRLKWLKNHDRTIMLGVPLKAEETPDYLKVRGQINLKKEIGRDTYADYVLMAENGLSMEHSVGVEAIQYDMDNEMGVRKVKEWKWWEYSTLDGWGANDRALTLEIKNMGVLPFVQKLNVLELKMKKGNYTDETFIEIEKSIHRIKSLLDSASELMQPVSADVLANASDEFIKSLQLT